MLATLLLGLLAFLAMQNLEYRMAVRVNGIVTDIVATWAAEHAPDALRQKDIAEEYLFNLVKDRERIDERIARARHVASGGHPDDSPTKWHKGQTKG